MLALLPGFAHAQCRPIGLTVMCSRAGCAPLSDPIAVALRAAADLHEMLDAAGYPNDAISLRAITFDGSLECALYGAARVDAVLRHVRETAAQHGEPRRMAPVVAAIEAAATNVRTSVQPRLAAAHARGAPPVVSFAGLLSAPAVPSQNLAPEREEPPPQWIAVPHPPAELPTPASSAPPRTGNRPRSGSTVRAPAAQAR